MQVIHWFTCTAVGVLCENLRAEMDFPLDLQVRGILKRDFLQGYTLMHTTSIVNQPY